jgi:hypothetical protein
VINAVGVAAAASGSMEYVLGIENQGLAQIVLRAEEASPPALWQKFLAMGALRW